jgi:hypothetical protein
MRDIDGNYSRFFQKPMWFDNLMSFAGVVITKLPSGDTIQQGTLVQLDGFTCQRNPALSAYDIFCHDTENTGMARVAGGGVATAVRSVNPVTLYPEGPEIAGPTPLISGAYFLSDRVLFGALKSRLHADTGSGTIEATLPTMSYGGYGTSISPGPEDGLVCIGALDSAVLYDHVNQEVVSWQRKLGFDAAFPMVYSPLMGVWLVVRTATTPEVHNTISIYSDEPTPATVSAPTALGTVSEGSSGEYRTRLLGANGEPCAGVLVDWSCTTPGVVQIAQSTTDVDGYAITRVALPIDSVGLNFDLTAEVLL